MISLEDDSEALKKVVISTTGGSVETATGLSYGANWGALSGQTPKYYKHDERVFLDGAADRTSCCITSGEVIATLPVNYRPPQLLKTMFLCGTNAICITELRTNGDIVITGTVTGSASTQLYFSGISFRL